MSKQKLFAFFCIVYFLTDIYPISRGKNIPGIDPLPIAIDSESPATQPTTQISPDTTTTEQPKDKTISTLDLPDFPRIRNLKVFMDSTYPYSAKIVWEVHPKTSTPIYVVRYSKPISTKEILLNSYNITSPPLSPSTTSFIDRDLPEGVYYYAAVTSFELSKEGYLVLKPEVNYTVNPFIVYRDSKTENISSTEELKTNIQIDRSKLKPSDYEISELSALSTEKGVVLNWEPSKIPEIKYKIYRGKEPLDSIDRLQKATLLGESTKPYFLDENPLKDEAVFYGVSTYDIVLNKEFSDLKFRKSYISYTYQKPQMEYQFLNYLPDSIIAYQVDKNSIQLFWVDSGPGVKFYKVYRSDEPINSEQKLENSKFLGVVQSGSYGFIDKDLTSGRYFYAVMPVISNNNELKLFYANRTFTTYSIVIDSDPITTPTSREKITTIEKKEESYKSNIKNISIRVEEQNNVRINWDYISNNNSKNIKILIYRSPVLIKEYKDLKNNSEYIGEFPLVAGVYLDRNLPEGKYYYNFVEFNTQSNEIVAFYYLKKYIEIKQESINDIRKETLTLKQETQETNETKNNTKEKDNLKHTKENIDYDSEIEKIGRMIFLENRLQKAQDQILEFLEKQKDLKREQIGKLKFYYGVILYKNNKKDEAKKLFSDSDVQKFDSTRANFWYKKILEEEL